MVGNMIYHQLLRQFHPKIHNEYTSLYPRSMPSRQPRQYFLMSCAIGDNVGCHLSQCLSPLTPPHIKCGPVKPPGPEQSMYG